MSVSGPDEEGDPLGIVSKSPFLNALRTVLENFEGLDLIEFSESVLDLSGPKRFSESADSFGIVFGIDEDEDIDLEESPVLYEIKEEAERQGPNNFFDIFMEVMDASVQQMQNKIFEYLIDHRQNEEDYVLLYSFLIKYQESARQLSNYPIDQLSDEERMEIFSPFVALYARLVSLAVENQTEFDNETIRDILRADYYSYSNEELDPSGVEEMDFKEVKEVVLKKGAAHLYEHSSHISVSRGAELAQTTVRDFEDFLSSQDIDIHYGPDILEIGEDDFRL